MPTDRNLTISYVGYETQTMPITASNSFIDIKLKENVATLQEVVVTGYASSENEAYAPRRGVKNYGETKRKSASGAAHTITDKAFKTEKLQVKENEQATTIAFDIDLPYTIPTNGKEYQVDIKEVNLPATYQYSVAPKLDNDAFLTAYLTDWEQYNLVEGEANLYFEGTYLGKTLLKTNSTEDTLKISLGRDKNVVVTRVKLKEFSKNKTFSSKKIDSRAFEISIKNKKSIPLSTLTEKFIEIII